DTAMNRAQIARALDVSDNTISKWIAQGMPVLEEGGNGREYAFSPADCYAWRRHRDAETRAAKAAADRPASRLKRAGQLRPFDPLNHSSTGLTLKQRGQWAHALGIEDRTRSIVGLLTAY
ncbi:terminase small subunit, partial [Rhodovulum sulfidophilum]|nr:terminase small subunit [Rhodovulum sulfidophilum]